MDYETALQIVKEAAVNPKEYTMRNQIKFTFQIGYPSQDVSFEADVIKAASKVCGGCTTATKTGWWMDDGASHADTFKGTLAREHCFELELTCEQNKAERAYDDICAAIAASALRHDVNTNWVHVSEVVMTGRHFSVEAINALVAA